MCSSIFLYFLQVGSSMEKLVKPDSYAKVLVVFTCSMMCHMTMQPRIYAGIERLHYVFMHPENFETTIIPTMVCVMKIITELGVEVTNFMVVIYTTDLLYLIMCYTAMIVISYTDQEYYDSMYHHLKAKMQDENPDQQLPITNKKYENVKDVLTVG